MVATVANLGPKQSFARGGGAHHARHHHHEQEHEHYSSKQHQHAEEPYDSHYHHYHDDYDDHHHECRNTEEVNSETGYHVQQCLDHDGNWEPDLESDN